MKKGDVVTVDDSSYSFTIVNGYLEHHPGGVQEENQIVIATNCDLPTDDGYGYSGSRHNDTIVRGQTSGKIAFVQQRFCHLVSPKHKVMVDIRQDSGWMYGQIVEISDKLYKEIKRDPQN